MTSRAGETHYKTLGLTQDCSSKDVRDAFVNLSKLHHPDRHSNNAESHNKFVKINEAYSVLCKPDLRRSYDNSLVSGRARPVPYTNTYRYQPPGQSGQQSGARPDPFYAYGWNWDDETIKRGRKAKSKFYTVHEGNQYYGFQGVRRKPNSTVAASAAFALMGLGLLFHFLAFKYSTTFSLARLEQQQGIHYSALDRSRQKANHNGNSVQLEQVESQLKAADRKPF